MKRHCAPSFMRSRVPFLRPLPKVGLILFYGVWLLFFCCHPVSAGDPPSAFSEEDKKRLFKDLGTQDPSLVFRAVLRIQEMNIPAAEALPHLMNAAANPSEFVRIAALNAIGNYGVDASPAVQVLIKSLLDKDPLVREAAALGLIALGPAVRGHVQSLIPLLHDENKKTRDASVMVLAGLGQEAVPQLMKALEGKVPVAAASASEALARIGPPAVGPLVEAMGKGGAAADLAGGALITMGTPAVKPLIRLLRDPQPEISQRAGRILVAIGTPAVEPLVEAVRSGR